MQGKLTDIVNNLTAQRENIKTAKQALKGKVRLRHPFKTAAKVKKLTKQLGQVKQAQSYAIKLQSQAVSHQMAATREMHTEDVSDTPANTQLPINNLMAAAKELKEQIGKEQIGSEALGNLEGIVAKFSRSDDLRDIKAEDLNNINTLVKLFNSMDIEDASPELKQLASLVQDMKQEVDTAFERGMEHLSILKMNGRAMQMLQDIEDGKEPQSDDEKIEWFAQCTELFSTFSDPFEPHIGIDGFRDGVLDALDGKESPFSEQIESMGTKEKGELREKVELLKKASSQIKDITTGKQYNEMRNDPKLRREMIKAKNNFLKNKRAQNKQRNNKSVSAIIIGGGPGGMIRSLVAGVKGHNSKVIEMRDSYTRDNMVKLSETPSMKYFGVKDRLVEKGVIETGKSSVEVKLKDLEDTLDDIAKEIYGDEEYRVTGQVVDIVPGNDGKANCLVKKGSRKGPKEDVMMSADLHVDSTGARADMGKMLEIGTQKMAGSQMMVALVMKKESSSKGKSEGTEFTASIPLSAPDQNYSLVQPNVENQAKLRELNEQRSQLWQQINSLKANSDKLQNSSIPELYRGNIEGRLPKDTLEALKNEHGGPEQYDAKLIEAAKEQITGLESKKEEVESETENILYTIASEQQGKTVTKSDVKQIAPFNIELHQRDQPSVVYGKSVMMYSGDSLATPDPKSGAGAGHALAGGTLFSKALDDQDNGLSPDQIRTRFNHGSKMHMEQVTGQGIGSRKIIKTEDPGLTTTHILKESSKLEFIKEDDVTLIQVMVSKKKYGGTINEQEKEELGTILDKLSNVQVFGSAKTATLEGLKDLIGKLKE